jgi:hypothetical protein
MMYRMSAPSLKPMACITALAVLLAACTPAPEDVDVPPREVPQTRAEVEAVRSVFNAIQPTSIEENREYCGYLFKDAFGLLAVTEPRRGATASCSPRWPRNSANVLASYHTHGAFDPDYDGEVPSYEDMASDILESVDGYVATPSGRVWYIDANRKEARLVCGPGCVVSDPTYQPGFDEIIRDRYTLQDLSLRGG